MVFNKSKTYQNLQKAFDGEIKASGKYAIYAAKAREDGYQQIGNIFEETSGNEKEHAEIWLKQLNNGEVPSTFDNLKNAFDGERYEWQEMYQNFAKEAMDEGYIEIATLFLRVAEIENEHDIRYRKLYDNIKNNKVFCKDKVVFWICLNCGNVYVGVCAPKKCPVCNYPQGYYQLKCNNF